MWIDASKMASGKFHNLGEEQRALHESWDDIVRVVLLVAALSVAVWAACAALRLSVHAASEWLFHSATHTGTLGMVGLVAALVVGGVVRSALIRLPGWKDAAGDGMSVALSNYHVTYGDEVDDPTPRYERAAFGLAARKWLTTFITLASGGSGGLEAPVVTLGEAIGAGWSRVMRSVSEHELRTYQLAAIAAGVSTLLGAPFTAALFAIEIAYTDRIVYRKLMYCLFAAVIAYVLNNRVFGFTPLFVATPHDQVYSLTEYAVTAVTAVLVSAPVALAFGLVMAQTKALVERVQPIWHGAAGGLGVGVIVAALWFGLGIDPVHVLGMGEHTIAELLAGDPHVRVWWVLLVILVGKMLTTGLTIQSGGSAGILVPSMVFGGVAGGLVAELLNLSGALGTLDTSVFVVAGIASALVAVIGVPLAAIALVLEVFGSQYGPPAIVSCGVTYVLTLRLSVYREQRIE